MTFKRPSLPELVERVQSDLISKTDQKKPLKKSMLRAFAYAIAGMAHIIFGNLEWIFKQAFPTTCNEVILAIWAYIFNVPRKQASFAEREFEFKGNEGSPIPALTIVRTSSGVEFETTEEVNIVTGVAKVRAISKLAGIDGNIEIGSAASLTSPILGIQSQVTVTANHVINGQGLEDVEEWRSRVIARIQNPPHGGTKADYEIWAKEVSGVTRCWVFPEHLGRGTVGVAFVVDNEADIFPNPSKVEEVFNYIEEFRPVGSEVVVFAPIPNVINFSIQIAPYSAAVREAVTNKLRELIKRQGKPGGTILISHVRESISLAIGEDDHILISPTENIVSGTGYLPVLGEIDFSVIP